MPQQTNIFHHDVFISYSSYDKAIADAICSKLENSSIRCWIAPRDIIPGVEFGEAIINGISDSKILLLVFSAKANDSPQVRREVERAVSKGKIIVPYRIEDILPTKAMEYALSNTHWLDAMTPPLEAHIKALSDTIHRLLNRQLENPRLEPEPSLAPKMATPRPGNITPAPQNQPLGVIPSEPYTPIVGVLIKDLAGAETRLTETTKSRLFIVRGSGKSEVRWDLVESVIWKSWEAATINFLNGKSIDNVKLNSGILSGTSDDGFTYSFEFAKLKSITFLKDTSVTEYEALIRDIPILAKQTQQNSAYTNTIRLDPDQEGILVTLDIFLNNQLATNGHQTFRLPGDHTFRASENMVSANIQSKGLFNLARYDQDTANVLAHALNRLNVLLLEKAINI